MVVWLVMLEWIVKIVMLGKISDCITILTSITALLSLPALHPYQHYCHYYSQSTLSWRDRKTCKIGIHLTENGSNQRHVIFDGR